MLTGKTLYSPYPHCRINAILTGKAKSIPGVHAVLTAKDVPGINRFVKTVPDQPLLAEGRARTTADPLAIVAAETSDAADAAIEAIELNLTPLPAVFDPEEALSPNAPQVHDAGNLAGERRIVHGDIEVGMAQADVIVEDTYVLPWVDHAYLETEAAVAAPGEDGHITLWRGSQNIYDDRLALSQILYRPEERFRVIFLPPGGSFGGKHNQEGLFAALLASYTSRPVRMVFDRKESLRVHNKRSRVRIHHKLGARADGHLTAAQVEMIWDNGAYTSFSMIVFDFACVQATGPYRVPHAYVHGRLVYTNNVPSGGMRGLGTPQVEFAVESQMDQLARRLGIHPLKLRWINAFREGDSAITGRLPPGCYFVDTLEAAALSVGVDVREGR
jgi:CO/xanthine dehydrogenase Mo-binding subunit